MAWFASLFGRNKITDFPAVVPKTTLTAGGGYRTITPQGLPIETLVKNHGPVDLTLTFGTTYVELQAGDAFTYNGAWGKMTVKNNHASVAGAFSMVIRTGRRMADYPDLTTANGFPAYDATNPNAVIPGV